MARYQSTRPAPAARLHALLEHKLKVVAGRCKEADQKADAAAAERDRVIVQALAAKLPRARIGAIFGLSAARIDQIRAAAEKAAEAAAEQDQ